MSNLQIRIYRESDFGPLTKPWREARLKASRGFMANNVHSFEKDCVDIEKGKLEENQVWVADQQEKAVGFLAIRGDFIDQLFVHPDHQNRGIGKAVLEEACCLSQSRLYLYTFQSNRIRKAFYEKTGL
jgi:ribosomal protein S18 acetylase RimI-like enzyme